MESEFYFGHTIAARKDNLYIRVCSLTDMSDPQMLDLRGRDISLKEDIKIMKGLVLRSPFAEQIINAISRVGNGLFLPDRLDANDPPRAPYNPEDLSGPSRWLSQPWGYVSFRKSKPFRVEGSLYNKRLSTTWTVENGKQIRTKSLRGDPLFPTELVMYISAKSLKKVALAELETAMYKLFDAAKGDYGFFCREHEYVSKNYLTVDTPVGQAYGFRGNDPEECLPGVYFANFFGPRYVEWFGKDRLLSAPWQDVKPLSRGAVLAHAGSSLDYYQDTSGADIAKKIINHLGPEAFFDRNERDRKYKTPFSH